MKRYSLIRYSFDCPGRSSLVADTFCLLALCAICASSVYLTFCRPGVGPLLAQCQDDDERVQPLGVKERAPRTIRSANDVTWPWLKARRVPQGSVCSGSSFGINSPSVPPRLLAGSAAALSIARSGIGQFLMDR